MSENLRGARERGSEEENRGPGGEKFRGEAVDAVRHVGPTLEAEGRYVPTGELPENQIANAAGSGAMDVRAATEDRYDREAEAMGADRLRTRLPGDTSSDPHTDGGADNPTNLDTDRDEAA